MTVHRASLLLLLAGLGCASANPKPIAKEPPMQPSDCTRTVSPADDDQLKTIIKAIPSGGVLCLSAGVYNSALWIDRSITIKGVGGDVVLDGKHERTVIKVVRDHVDFVLEHVTVRNGAGSAMGDGGNLSIDDSHTVTLRDVVLDGGQSDANGGGAIYLHGGQVLLERCRLRGNRGARAQAILIDNGSLTLRDCLVVGNVGPAPAVLLDQVSRLALERCTIAANGSAAIRIGGNIDFRPHLEADACILGDPPLIIAAPDSEPRPSAVIRNSALSAAISREFDGGGNSIRAIEVDENGRLPGLPVGPR